MIHANVGELKARLSHYLKLAKNGERVMICERNRPIAEIVGIRPAVDRELRESAFGMFGNFWTEAELTEALRPLTDDEVDAFLDGTL